MPSNDEHTLSISLISLFQPFKGMLLTPKNVEYYATFIRSDVDIQERVIHFGTGVANEKLLEVPIGEIDPQAAIIVTVGLNRSHPNTAGVDSDPVVGISDGTNENLFLMWDVNSYPGYSPCETSGRPHDSTKITSGTQVPSMFKLTFIPFHKYGFCETAQNGGYINTGTFPSQIDITKPLFLIVKRSSGSTEQYYYHYFMVEIYEGL